MKNLTRIFEEILKETEDLSKRILPSTQTVQIDYVYMGWGDSNTTIWRRMEDGTFESDEGETFTQEELQNIIDKEEFDGKELTLTISDEKYDDNDF
jgi:hypothetical protein